MTGEGGLLEKNNEGSAKPAVQGVVGQMRARTQRDLLGFRSPHRSGVPARFLTGADRKWLGELSGSFMRRQLTFLDLLRWGASPSHMKDA